MKKSALIILLSFLLFGCYIKQKRDDEMKNKLENLFRQSINSDTKLTFRLDTITAFKWDNFLIIPPYTQLSFLSKKINIDLSILKKTGIEYSDDKSILVFIKNNKVLKFTEYPRNPGDFANINSLELFIPENAIFKLTKTNQKVISQKEYYIIEKVN